MAYGLQGTENVDPPDADYPYGQVRDNPGDQSGTPANKQTLGDFHQFFARLLDQAGIIPNGLPDNAYSGFQYFEALVALFGGRSVIVEMGPWDMVADSLILVPHGLPDFLKIRSVTGVIFNDAQSFVFPISGDEVDTPSVGPTTVTVRRASASSFDSTAFDDAVMNRGYLKIDYVE